MNENDYDEMSEEYDFSNGVRGKYVSRLAAAGLVRLEPDVAAVFKDQESVNEALRGLIPVINSQINRTHH